MSRRARTTPKAATRRSTSASRPSAMHRVARGRRATRSRAAAAPRAPRPRDRRRVAAPARVSPASDAVDPGACGEQPRPDPRRKLAIRLACVAGPITQVGGGAGHRQLVAKRVDLLEVQIGSHPAREQAGLSRHLRRHVRVAVAVASNPRTEAHRRRVERQPSAGGSHERAIDAADESAASRARGSARRRSVRCAPRRAVSAAGGALRRSPRRRRSRGAARRRPRRARDASGRDDRVRRDRAAMRLYL